MTEAELEQRLADTLADYQSRRARGEHPLSSEYADALGPSFVELGPLLETEALLHAVVEPPPEEPLPRLFGPYVLQRVLGRGASGVVYEGRHQVLGRKHAVKVLRQGFVSDPESLQRFEREAHAMAAVRHEHIVDIHGAGHVGGRPYYAMDLVRGSTLRDLARSDPPPSPEAVCRGLAGIAGAVQALHDTGIRHRDIKPSNIMVDESGAMHLADFGLARSAGSATMTLTGQAMGTPLYSAPEQLLGHRRDVDERSDVYGLGASLYEALAGHPPFRADDLRALYARISRERPRPIRRIRPSVPAAADAIALKALEKRREDRYPTAGAMQSDLLALSEGRTVQGRPVSALRRAGRQLRRRALPLVAALALLALGLFAYGRRDGHLVIGADYVGARLVVDGRDHGATPARVAVEPGAHEIRLLMGDVEVYAATLDIAAGSDHHLHGPRIDAQALNDAVAVGRVLRSFGLGPAPLAPPIRVRTGRRDATGVAWPAGTVPAAEVGTYRLDVGADVLTGPGSVDGLEVLLRDAEAGGQLWRAAVDLERPDVRGTFPENVVEILRAGGRFELGIQRRDGRFFGAPFRVVPDDPAVAARLGWTERLLSDAPAPLRAYVRARILLELGHPSAALRAALGQATPWDPASKPMIGLWGVAESAALTLDLGETRLYGDIRDALQGFPEAVRDEWFSAPTDGPR